MNALCLSAKAGHADIVSALLAHPEVDPDRPTQCGGHVALVTAAFNGREDVVADNLDSSADPNATNDKGYSGLHWAASKGCQEVARRILSHPEVEVDARLGYSGETAMMLAADRGHVDLMRAMIAKEADLARYG